MPICCMSALFQWRLLIMQFGCQHKQPAYCSVGLAWNTFA